MNDATMPSNTVTPQTSEVRPEPRLVSPKIVPRHDPNPMKPPSMQKNASSSRTKFLFCNASFMLTRNLIFLGSYIATKLGGCVGFARIRRNSGIAMHVTQKFCIRINLISASFISYFSVSEPSITVSP